MAFRALLVSRDDQATEIVAPVLSSFGLAVQHREPSDAVRLVTEQKFEAVLVDFDDPHTASAILEKISGARFQHNTATVALLSDKGQVRRVFGAGANFVLYKPVSDDEADSTLRSAIALILRERRNSYRVSVQVPVKLRVEGNTGRMKVEGILLDFSETGMDVLSQQPLYASARLSARLMLPDFPSEIDLQGEVAWANPNGESGVRFLDLSDKLRAALRTWVIDHSQDFEPQAPGPVHNGKLTDLSPGGCYLQTASPFPEGTWLSIALRAEGAELQLPGTVLVMHPAHGMGIEFASSNVRRVQLEKFIHLLSSRPGIEPEISISLNPHLSLPSEPAQPGNDVDDPLLNLLRGHERFSEERFIAELRKQRRTELLAQ